MIVNDLSLSNSIIESDGSINPDPFIHVKVDAFNERGLLGIALHPDFDNNPFVYLYYTVPFSNHNRVSRFRANGDLAIPNSEEIILELDNLSAKVHNGGAMLFDTAGYLFIATGDGGNSGNSQDTTNLLGKILRLNADGSIPTDNPFYTAYSGKNKSIFSLGLRNPFNLSYSPTQDKLYATDVGAGDFEEINLILAKQNYGWPLIEGPIDDQAPPKNYQDPFYAYTHDEGCAIVGLNVYTPKSTDFPNRYIDNIFFADYCEGYVRVIDGETGDLIEDFAKNVDRPLIINEHEETGSIYYLSRGGTGGGSSNDNTLSKTGSLWKINYSGSGLPHISAHPQDRLIPIGESVLFSIRATGDSTLFYAWYVNDTFYASNDDTLILNNMSIQHDSTLICVIVSNWLGADTSETALLSVTNNLRPIPQIISPVDGRTFRAGDTIFFSGIIVDNEDGTIADIAYNWKIDLHHDEHTHPMITNMVGVSDSFFIIPIVGETDTNIWIRIYLSGADSEGLVGTKYNQIYPEIAQIVVDGFPGSRINIDGVIRELPVTFSTLANLQRTLFVQPIQDLPETMVYFTDWGDGFEENTRVVRTVDSMYLIVNSDTIVKGAGTGLIASYYNDPEFDFDEAPGVRRIDSVINWRWGNDSPQSPEINEDDFSARWEGYILPLATESYTFFMTLR